MKVFSQKFLILLLIVFLGLIIGSCKEVSLQMIPETGSLDY
jgi:hypothetical protein